MEADLHVRQVGSSDFHVQKWQLILFAGYTVGHNGEHMSLHDGRDPGLLFKDSIRTRSPVWTFVWQEKRLMEAEESGHDKTEEDERVNRESRVGLCSRLSFLSFVVPTSGAFVNSVHDFSISCLPCC